MVDDEAAEHGAGERAGPGPAGRPPPPHPRPGVDLFAVMQQRAARGGASAMSVDSEAFGEEGYGEGGQRGPDAGWDRGRVAGAEPDGDDGIGGSLESRRGDGGAAPAGGRAGVSPRRGGRGGAGDGSKGYGDALTLPEKRRKAGRASDGALDLARAGGGGKGAGALQEAALASGEELREAELRAERAAAAVRDGMRGAMQDAAMRGPPPPLRTNRTRRVLHPVLIGHAASFTRARGSPQPLVLWPEAVARRPRPARTRTLPGRTSGQGSRLLPVRELTFATDFSRLES